MMNRKYFLRAAAVFSENVKNALCRVAQDGLTVYEIRVYASSPLVLYAERGLLFVNTDGSTTSVLSRGCIYISQREMIRLVLRACDYSPFVHEQELKQGYLTFGDGIRMGIGGDFAGNAFCPDKVTSAVIRIPCLLNQGLCEPLKELLANGSPSVMFAGAPGSGKTTVLRQCIAYLTSENNRHRKRLAVVDERGELGAFTQAGQPCFADILCGVPKAQGIQQALRLLNPAYIVIDELGTALEAERIAQGMNSGVSFLASIHAANRKELLSRPQFELLHRKRVFSHIVFLSAESPGEISEVAGSG